MSVDAINAAEPQRKSPVGAAIGTGVVLGAAGAGTGYLMSKRPDLEKVFAMPADKFEAATKDAKDEVKTAADTIAEGRNEYAKAGEAERKILREKGKDVADLIKGQTPENAELATNLQKAKSDFDAIGKVKITNHEGKEIEVTKDEVIKAVKDARAKLNAATTAEAKTGAETELANAKKNAKAFFNHADVKDKNTALKNARKAMSEAKIAKFEAEAAKEGENAAKTAKTELQNARNSFETVKKTKMTELVGKQEYKDAFAKIQKLFSREHVGKNMGIYGGIAAAVGLIAGYLMGGKKEA